MQFSLSEDGRRADIDVDYRSSRSPRALFNGHLTSANSDVRVGENPRLHNGRWNGFIAWWQDVFGRLNDATLPSRDLLYADRPPVPTPLPPDRPLGAAPERIEDAVQEFLTDWLVRSQFDQALDALSPHAYACLNLDDNAGSEALLADQARQRLQELMEYVVDELGRATSLTDAIVATLPRDPARNDRRPPLQPGVHAHARGRSGGAAVSLWSGRDASREPRLPWSAVHVQARGWRNAGVSVAPGGRTVAARFVSVDEAVATAVECDAY